MKTNSIRAICIILFLFATTAMATADKGEDKESDLWLKAKIVTTYTLNQHLNPFKLTVEVKDGVAHLSGTVDSEVERNLAVEIAKGVDGISDVKEDIKVEPGAMAEERQESEFFRRVEDATITAKVKSKLLWNRNTDGLDINVTTENGVVTLKGKADSDAQKDLAVQLTRNTTGVERVKNELNVVSKPEKTKTEGMLEEVETKASDAWITAKVKSMLLFSKETEGATIEVSTTDQVVTLKGSVTSEEQKDQILKMVGDTVGVRDVRADLAMEKG